MSTAGRPHTTGRMTWLLRERNESQTCTTTRMKMEMIPLMSGTSLLLMGVEASSANRMAMTSSNGCSCPIWRFPITRTATTKTPYNMSTRTAINSKTHPPHQSSLSHKAGRYTGARSKEGPPSGGGGKMRRLAGNGVKIVECLLSKAMPTME